MTAQEERLERLLVEGGLDQASAASLAAFLFDRGVRVADPAAAVEVYAEKARRSIVRQIIADVMEDDDPVPRHRRQRPDPGR